MFYRTESSCSVPTFRARASFISVAVVLSVLAATVILIDQCQFDDANVEPYQSTCCGATGGVAARPNSGLGKRDSTQDTRQPRALAQPGGWTVDQTISPSSTIGVGATNDQKGPSEVAETAFDEFNRQNYGYAKALWRQALQVDPLNVQILQGLAMAHQAEGTLDEYLEFYRTHLLEHPEALELYGDLAKALVGVERQDEAIRVLEMGVAANDENPQFRYLLADFHAEKGEISEAISLYKVALNQYPQDAWGRFFLGQLYWRLDPALAVVEFDIASSISPSVATEVSTFLKQRREEDEKL